MMLLRWLGRIVWRIATVLLALIGATVVAVGAVAAIAYFVLPVPGLKPVRLPPSMVLTLTIDGKLGSSDGDGLSRAFRSGRLGLEDTIAALVRAEADERVKGVMLDLGRATPGLAETQELRESIRRLRAAGKPTVAFADSFGEGAGRGSAYYLASAADQVWMQPSGDWSWTGVSLEGFFLKETLEKFGVAADMIQRYEYKGAMEPLTRTTFSAPVRENIGHAVENWFAQMLIGAAEGRKIAEADLRARVAEAPLSAGEALRSQLVDRLGYRRDALDAAGARDGKAEAVSIERYFRRVGTPWKEGPTIAVILGDGEIVRAEGRSFGSARFSADRIGKAIDDAAEDPDVAAIVIRIDSPGGSYVASDTLFDHIRQARKSKPVIASLKDVAASGGYFVALAADRIVASPGTLTGSVGVVGGKVVISELMAKAGISSEAIEIGEHAGMWRMTRPFTAEERRRIEAMFDRAYSDFTQKVAEARKLSAEDVDRIARGRIWTGEDAQKLRLTDADGGLLAALAAAKQLAGIAADAKISVETYPPPKAAWEVLRDTLLSGDLPDDIDTILGGIRWIAAAMRLMPEAGLQLR